MSSRTSTWRVSRATNFRDVVGSEIVVTYDDSGIGLRSLNNDSALSVPWHTARCRLTRRSSTWELQVRETPWGDLTLTTFRPTVTPNDLAAWEGYGVICSRWRWSRLTALSLVCAIVSYVGISWFMESHGVVRIVERSLLVAKDVPGGATTDTTESPLVDFISPPHAVIRQGIEFTGPVGELRGSILSSYVSCTGIPSAQDRLFGRGALAPAAAGFSGVFRPTSNPTFSVGMMSEIYSDRDVLRRATQQIRRSGVLQCVAATYARLVIRASGSSGSITGAHDVPVTTLTGCSVRAARASLIVAGRHSELYVALVTYGRFRVTVLGYGSNDVKTASLFSETVATVSHKLTGAPVATA